MLLSFIITYHNEPIALLEECIRSILQFDELLSEYEIIVIDDGSNVSPKERILSLAPKTVYIRQDCAGLSVARNNGISHAKGEYIQFVDADDALASSYKGIIRLLGDEKDIIQFCFYRNQEFIDQSEEQPKVMASCSGTDYLQQHNLKASACSYTFRRRILNDLRFRQGLYHEDELFTPLLYLNAQSVVVVNTKAYFYRIRNNSITTSQDESARMKRINDFKGIILELQQCSKESPALSRRVNQLSMDFAYLLYNNKYKKEEKTLLIAEMKSHGLYPLPVKMYSWKYFVFSILSRFL